MGSATNASKGHPGTPGLRRVYDQLLGKAATRSKCLAEFRKLFQLTISSGLDFVNMMYTVLSNHVSFQGVEKKSVFDSNSVYRLQSIQPIACIRVSQICSATAHEKSRHQS